MHFKHFFFCLAVFCKHYYVNLRVTEFFLSKDEGCLINVERLLEEYMILEVSCDFFVIIIIIISFLIQL